jgi:hypothetical protein
MMTVAKLRRSRPEVDDPPSPTSAIEVMWRRAERGE